MAEQARFMKTIFEYYGLNIKNAQNRSNPECNTVFLFTGYQCAPFIGLAESEEVVIRWHECSIFKRIDKWNESSLTTLRRNSPHTISGS